MAFAIQTLLLLLELHRAEALEGPVLNLGRQTVTGTYRDMLNVFGQAGVLPVPLPEDLRARAVAGTPQHGDRLFFAHLGLDLTTMDVSDYEGAELIHDLNLPVPGDLHGRFKTVIDGGTTEHVFDVRAAFQNIADLAAPGGSVIHMSPCNNYVNHGFWQLSPRSFFDYYHVNGFENLRATMLVTPRDYDMADKWGTFEFDPRGQFGAASFFTNHNERLTCLFRARKTSRSTSDQIPNQSFDNASAGGTPMEGNQFTLELSPEGLVIKQVG